jgi:hypothetical protein
MRVYPPVAGHEVNEENHSRFTTGHRAHRWQN